MSRELDALIAEHVMGWTKRISADHTGSPIKALRAIGVIYAWKDAKKKEQGLDVPRYSTDIAAAWMVVDRMRTHVPDYRALRMESVPLGYTVAFYSHKNPLNRVGAFVAAETAPLAICLAALKALNIEIPVEETRGA